MKKQEIIDFFEHIANLPSIKSNSKLFDFVESFEKEVKNFPGNEIPYFGIKLSGSLNQLARFLLKDGCIVEAVKLLLMILPLFEIELQDEEGIKQSKSLMQETLSLLSKNLSNPLFLDSKISHEIWLLASMTFPLKIKVSEYNIRCSLFQCLAHLANISNKLEKWEKWDEQIDFFERALCTLLIEDSHLEAFSPKDPLCISFDSLFDNLNQIKNKAINKVSLQRVINLNFWLVKFYLYQFNERVVKEILFDYVNTIKFQVKGSVLEWDEIANQAVQIGQKLQELTWFKDAFLFLREVNTILTPLEVKSSVFKSNLAKIKKIAGEILYLNYGPTTEVTILVTEAIALQTWVCENAPKTALSRNLVVLANYQKLSADIEGSLENWDKSSNLYLSAIENYTSSDETNFPSYALFICHKNLAKIYHHRNDFEQCHEQAKAAIQTLLKMGGDVINHLPDNACSDICEIYELLVMTPSPFNFAQDVFKFGHTVFSGERPSSVDANIRQFYWLADQLQLAKIPFNPVIQDFINIATLLTTLSNYLPVTHFQAGLEKTGTRNKFEATLKKLKEVSSLQNIIEGQSLSVAVTRKLLDQDEKILAQDKQITQLKTEIEKLKNELELYKQSQSTKNNSHPLEAESGEGKSEKPTSPVSASSPLLAKNHPQGQAPESETNKVVLNRS